MLYQALFKNVNIFVRSSERNWCEFKKQMILFYCMKHCMQVILSNFKESHDNASDTDTTQSQTIFQNWNKHVKISHWMCFDAIETQQKILFNHFQQLKDEWSWVKLLSTQKRTTDYQTHTASMRLIYWQQSHNYSDYKSWELTVSSNNSNTFEMINLMNFQISEIQSENQVSKKIKSDCIWCH